MEGVADEARLKLDDPALRFGTNLVVDLSVRSKFDAGPGE
jgi:hypothetical protein